MAVLGQTYLNWLLLSIVGVLVLTPLRRAHWVAWLPAAPVVGAAFLAVTLHLTSGFAPIWVGLIVVLVVLAGIVGYGLTDGRRPWRLGWRPWVGLVGAAAAGLPGAVAALLPNFAASTGRVVVAGSTMDSFFYVSEANWFRLHGMYPLVLPTSKMGGEFLPAYGPAVNSVRISLRMGQAMIQSVTDLVTGRDSVDSSTSWMACYVVITAGAAVTAGRLLRWSRVSTWALAVLIPSSSALVYMVRQQNQDSLLGVSLALLAAVSLLAVANRRSPRVLSALLVAGLVACYVELALFVAPLVLFGTLGRSWSRLPRAVLRTAQVVGLAVIMAPLAWWRGAHSFLGSASGADGFPSPFLDVPFSTAVGRLLGAAWMGFEPTSARTLLLLIPVVVGVLASLALSPQRAAWFAVLLVGIGYGLYNTVEHRGYSQGRVLSLLVPFLILVAVAGWDVLVRRGWVGLGRQWSWARSRTARIAGVAVLLLLALSWPANNLQAARHSYTRVPTGRNVVDGSYGQVADWVAAHGGPGGSDVTVLVPDLFASTWLVNDLRRQPNVQYGYLYGSYVSVSSFTRNIPTRYMITGRGAQVIGDPAAAVETAGDFTIWDTSLGSVITATPGPSGAWDPYSSIVGFSAPAAHSSMLLTRSPSAPHLVYLRLKGVGPNAFTLRLHPDHGPDRDVRLAQTPTQVGISMGTARLMQVTTSVPGAGKNHAPLQFTLLGVAIGD